MGMRILSKESTNLVYHRPECRYARKIYRKNRVQMEWEEAEWKGYRPCKYCDGADFLYNLERDKIECFSESHNLDVDLRNKEIYVRTDVGCWKIIYKRSKQKFILLHRNYVSGRISFNEMDDAPYHRQGDMADSGSIMKYLKYIHKHDAFKQNKPADLRLMPQNTRQQKAYYRSARKREAKRSARRLDNLFFLIERKEGMKQLSFC